MFNEKLDPLLVVDKVAARNFNTLCDSKLFQVERRYISTSDVNVKIDIFWGKFTVDKKISHLPLPEQELLYAKVTEANSLKGKMSMYKLKAYGKKGGQLQNAKHSMILDIKRAEILELFGQFYTLKEVHKIVSIDWHIKVGLKTLSRYRLKYIDKINELQEAHKRDYSSLRLSHKKSRLEELSQLYNIRKGEHTVSKSREEAKVMMAILKQIEHEVDGDRLIVDGKLSVDVEMTVNNHLTTNLLDKLPVLDIILGRIAGRMNCDPSFLISRLHNSVYSKFNATQLPDGDLADPVAYPSAMVYDFDKLKRLAEDRQQKEKAEMQIVKLDDTQKEEANELKQRIVNAINARRKKAEESGNKMVK